MASYRIGSTPATYHQVGVVRLQPGDYLYVISRQDRVAHVVSSVGISGDFVEAQVSCQGRQWTARWHKSARLAVLRKAA